jgi:hypothetical protein
VHTTHGQTHRLERELEDARKSADAQRLRGDDKDEKMRQRQAELLNQVELLQRQLEDTVPTEEQGVEEQRFGETGWDIRKLRPGLDRSGVGSILSSVRVIMLT